MPLQLALHLYSKSECNTDAFIYDVNVLDLSWSLFVFYHLYFNSFQTVSYRTPTIESLSPVSGPPGNVCSAFSYFTEFILNLMLIPL